LLRHARRLASVRVRTLAAIHLATAAYVEPDAVLVYDRRLAEACTAEGHVVTAPQ
jgi:predicted nucleic acid-binding protein